MENEIELKIMLRPENVAKLTAWLARQDCLFHETESLGNAYYDTTDHYFARHKMGLRVRSKNQRYELTLKTQGEIVGGLHIRPEYNLPLPNAEPDFKRLVSSYNLQMPEIGALIVVFSTDFVREKYLIQTENAQIEIALDQGLIKNAFGEEAICELELELKDGNLAALLDFLDELPKFDGMWLSGLSKAQRGYLAGNQAEIAKNIEKLTACNPPTDTHLAQYSFEQQLADFARLAPDNQALSACLNLPCSPENRLDYLTSADHLAKNINMIKKLYSEVA